MLAMKQNLVYINLFFQCRDQLSHIFFFKIDNNRKSVNPLNFTFGNGQALDIDFATRKPGRDAMQHARMVFAEYGNREYLFHCQVVSVGRGKIFGPGNRKRHSSRISATAAPEGTIGNTLFSLPTITSSRNAPS